jgi:hypothetical protein
MDGMSAHYNTGYRNDGELWMPDMRRDEQLVDIDQWSDFDRSTTHRKRLQSLTKVQT